MSSSMRTLSLEGFSVLSQTCNIVPNSGPLTALFKTGKSPESVSEEVGGWRTWGKTEGTRIALVRKEGLGATNHSLPILIRWLRCSQGCSGEGQETMSRGYFRRN